MMRLTMTVWWSLALVWLLTSQAGAESARDQAARSVEVTGYGPSASAAKRNSLNEAIEKLKDQLRRENLEHWQPTEAYVLEHLVDGAGRPGPDVPTGVPDPAKAKTWILTLNIPAPDELRQLDRQALRLDMAEARLGLALRIAAALALVLAVIIGCIRADEWTQSRYTRWLRLAAVGALAAAGAGWWCLR